MMTPVAESVRRYASDRLFLSAAIAILISVILVEGGGRALLALPVLAVTLAVYAAIVLRRRSGWLSALESGLDEGVSEFIRERVPFYGPLDPEQRRRFEDLCAIFLYDHRITGVDGITPGPGIRGMVASSAARLILGRPEWSYPDFGEVLIYPGEFSDDGSFSTDPAPRESRVAGMAHSTGSAVILSLPHLVRGFSRPGEGNVALHEFAHVLDGLPWADGIPDNLPAPRVKPWTEMMRKEFEKVRDGRSVLRDYAGKNPAELFAVAVEVFFESPLLLKARQPDLYEGLKDFFGQDPAAGASYGFLPEEPGVDSGTPDAQSGQDSDGQLPASTESSDLH